MLATSTMPSTTSISRVAAVLAIGAVGALVSAQPAAIDPELGIPVGGGPIDPGPVPAGIDAIDAATCGECHERHYREWRESTHRSAFTNPIFLAEFRPRERAFCENCHAPREDAETGIDCAVCHVREGAVLNPTVSGRAPHQSRAAAELAGTLACARCHQFAFEGRPDEQLQRTVQEWMRSEHRQTTCQGCHMPTRGGHTVHRFPGAFDRTLLRDAIATAASARVDGARTVVRLELRADGAGHAVPTGDMFRHLEVRAWPIGHPERAVTTSLARRFRVDEAGWHERADERVPATGTRVVELELPERAARVVYAVDLWRTPMERARQLGWTRRDVSRPLVRGSVASR